MKSLRIIQINQDFEITTYINYVLIKPGLRRQGIKPAGYIKYIF